MIKPAKKNVKLFLENIRGLIKQYATTKTENLIYLLNPKLKWWGNYYRHVVSKAIFGTVDKRIFQAFWRWIKRRHPKKNATWKRQKYFGTVKLDHWVFQAKQPYEGGYRMVRLHKVNNILIQRHVKIRANANPYDPQYQKYFRQRDLGIGLIRHTLSM